ncbi:MAG: hypothetical protein ACKVQS_09110 [Fimbriimonadaceae bacterium]
MAAPNRKMFLYGGLAILGIAGFYLTEPEKPKASTEGTALRKPAGSSSTRGAKVEIYTEEDQNAQFARLEEPLHNAFTPAVVDSKGSRSVTSDLPNQIPPVFMNGESGWLLTGIVNFDGKNEALLENGGTNEGQYLSIGQTIKNATLVDITRNSITLSGPNGLTQTFMILEDRPIVDDTNLSANNSPFDPLVGNIGISQPSNSANNRSAQNNKTGNGNEATNATN